MLSFLCFRPRRYEHGVSVSEISRCTHLHHRAVRSAFRNLESVVVSQDGKWEVESLPSQWFKQWKATDHWYNVRPYLMLYRPRRGAVIRYQETTRRFGLNPKTIKAALNDLDYTGLVTIEEQGRSFDICLKTLNSELLVFFEHKPDAESVALKERPSPKKKSDPVAYEFRGEQFLERVLDIAGILRPSPIDLTLRDNVSQKLLFQVLASQIGACPNSEFGQQEIVELPALN